MLNYELPEAIWDVPSHGRHSLKPKTVKGVADSIFQLLKDAERFGVGTLSAFTDNYLINQMPMNRDIPASKALAMLKAIMTLHGYAPYLPEKDRPALTQRGLDIASHRLNKKSPPRGENMTERIDNDTILPLIAHSLAYVERFAPSIIRAQRHLHDLEAQLLNNPRKPPIDKTEIVQWIGNYVDLFGGLPGRMTASGLKVNSRFIGLHLNMGKHFIVTYINRFFQRVPVVGRSPFLVPVHAVGVDMETPWTDFIDANTLHHELNALYGACIVVIAYLSGLRPEELLSLKIGCCPDPAPLPWNPDGPPRYQLHGLTFKGHNNLEDRISGVEREIPWAAIKPIADAIAVVESLHVSPVIGDYLFTSHRPWMNESHPKDQALASEHATRYFIDRLITQANHWCDATGNSELRILDDPYGRINLVRFRRTLAHFIATQPNGNISVAIQYSHADIRTGIGYSSVARQGISPMIDEARARYELEVLQELNARAEAGENISGAGANALIRVAKKSREHFRGVLIDRNTLKKWSKANSYPVHINDLLGIACVFDPDKALCVKGMPSTGNMKPLDDRCQPNACGNAATTDSLVEGLQLKIVEITEAIGVGHLPQPLRDRMAVEKDELVVTVERHYAAIKNGRSKSLRDEGTKDE